MIIKYPDPILSKPVGDFDFNYPPESPSDIATKLISEMNNHNGISLSANQLGLSYRVFCMRGHPENYVCFNPRIVYNSPEVTLMEEACVSFPGVTVKVKRSKEIRVRFQTPSGMLVTKKFDGLTARTFQHELDHLDGLLFFNRANRYHREKALKGYYNG